MHTHAAVMPGCLPLQSDKTSAGDTPEKTIENALWAFKQEIKHKTDNVSAGICIKQPSLLQNQLGAHNTHSCVCPCLLELLSMQAAGAS